MYLLLYFTNYLLNIFQLASHYLTPLCLQPTEVWTDLHSVTGSKGKSINITINTHTDKLSNKKNRQTGPQSAAANHEQSDVSKPGLIFLDKILIFLTTS